MSTTLKVESFNGKTEEPSKSQLYIKMMEVVKEHLVIEARLKNHMPRTLRNQLTERAKKLEIQYGLLVASWNKLNESKKMASIGTNESIQQLLLAFNDSYNNEQVLQCYSYLQQRNLNLLPYKEVLQQEETKYITRLDQDFEQFLSSLDYSQHLVNSKGKGFKVDYLCAVFTVGKFFGLQHKSAVEVLARKFDVQKEIKVVSLSKVKEICSPNWKLTSNSIECESWNILLLAEALLLVPSIIDIHEQVDPRLLESISLSGKEVRDIITFTNQLKADAFDYTSSMLQIQKYELLRMHAKQFEKNAYKEIELTNRILVVGTMSSGKSTFLNSLIGQDLFPSKNEACTAKMFEYSLTNKPHYTLKKSTSNKVQTYETLTPELLEKLNEASDQASLYITGPSKSVVTINKKLTFIDTPGPNNSADSSHRDMMKKAMQGDYDKILYIINSTQLGTTDDMQLLQMVKDFLVKNPSFPIYFIVNKVDEFDNDSNENIHTLRANVVKYLQAQGFANPNILFVSALTAKLIQNDANNQPMSRKERTQLRIFTEMMLESDYNLSQYCVYNDAPIGNHTIFAEGLTENQKILFIHSGIAEVLNCL